MKANVLVVSGIVALSLCASHASADTMYAVDYSGSATLYTVDQSTGAITAVGAVGLDNVGDLTSDGVSNIWGIQITTNSLVSINASTGAGTLGPAITGTAPPTGGPALPIVSLAYNKLTSTLYGNTSVPFGGATADELYSIDITTGAATDIGAIGQNSVFALGFGQTGVLYGVDGNGNFISINLTTGAGTVIGSTGVSFAFDIASNASDVMFLADTGTSSLYTVNVSTGAATLVGGYGSITNVVGLADLGAAAVPEPGTLLLLVSGLLGAAATRRTRARRS